MFETALAVLLATLRLGPLLVFAPPFSLVRLPIWTRTVLAMALALCVLGISTPVQAQAWRGDFVSAASSELVLGIAMALPLQLAFAMIGVTGRALDIQAGFGLAFLIDPTTRAQMPLIGALFTYAAAAIFFATGGVADVLAVLSASFAVLPLGAAAAPGAVQAVLAFLGTVAILSMGVAGLAILTLLLIDLVIAMLSRTLPQMNVLVLGFQVKALTALLLLPLTLGLSAGIVARILRLAIEAMTRIA
ncbi:MAG: flagellar biosynthetic protein FliR [Novosphingobium sp.]|uniref:flagellar biosynthetic protein FliR n=1 Tax=Novosphingobium sp. TaxID=1874826 RepID=UPI0032B7A49E